MNGFSEFPRLSHRHCLDYSGPTALWECFKALSEHLFVSYISLCTIYTSISRWQMGTEAHERKTSLTLPAALSFPELMALSVSQALNKNEWQRWTTVSNQLQAIRAGRDAGLRNLGRCKLQSSCWGPPNGPHWNSRESAGLFWSPKLIRWSVNIWQMNIAQHPFQGGSAWGTRNEKATHGQGKFLYREYYYQIILLSVLLQNFKLAKAEPSPTSRFSQSPPDSVSQARFSPRIWEKTEFQPCLASQVDCVTYSK